MRKSPYFKRSPRLKLALPTGKMVVHSPKQEPKEPKFSFESMVIPIFLTAATVGIMFWLSKTVMNNSMYPIFMLAMSVPMIGSYTATIVMHFRKKKAHRTEVETLHREYLEQIEKHQKEIEDIRADQEAFLRQHNPHPDHCLERIHQRKSTLWERTPQTDDFLELRVGIGKRPFQMEIEVPNQQGYDVNPLIAEAQKLQEHYREVVGVPVTIPLKEKRVVGLVGDRAEILNLARVLSLQLVTHHSPEEVKVVSNYSEEEEEEWSWMRWLPHTWSPGRKLRYMAKGQEETTELFETLYSMLNIRRLEKGADNKKEAHVPEFVFFLSDLTLLEDDPLLPLLLNQEEEIGACTFLMSPEKETLPMECELIIEVKNGVAKLYETFAGEDEIQYFTGSEKVAIDQFSLKEAKEMARASAPLRVKESAAINVPNVLTFLSMYEKQRVEELNVLDRWNENRYPLTLPVIIGVREGNKPVFLNIHDKIEKGGHGPHGLMAGTTGSGKSEVIQSIILSLALTYHPHELSFMLIDYKGGGMSNTFDGLPHVVAAITNLEDPNLIQRAKTSLRAELERRQKLFNKAGNLQHIDEYFKSEWRFKEPLPHLFIVIDEFAQLKKEQPEFMDELVSIAAIGRTLGVHLLLATQKPTGVVNDKIWSNSRFKVCLRVQDETDSREMIKIPNAADINVPGRGYFQVGNNEVLEYFQSAWSGAPYHPEKEEQERQIEIAKIGLNGARSYYEAPKSEKETEQKQINALIHYISNEAKLASIEPLQGPWQPPLPQSLPITDLIESEKWSVERWEEKKEGLIITSGLIDDVRNQTQFPISIDLEAGHFLIYGMPGSGKTYFLQSALLSLFFNYAPSELNAYVIDFSRQFHDFNYFPHVGDVIGEEQEEKMMRLFKFLQKELRLRISLFSEHGVSSPVNYRRLTGEELPAIVVAIDGYATFRKTFEEENEQFEYLLRDGAKYGIYFITSINQANDMYERYRNNFQSAVAFELADRSDFHFAVGRPDFAATDLPPGRGFIKGSTPPYMFQAATPYEGEDELEKMKFLQSWGKRMKEENKGSEAFSIPLVPKLVTLKDLYNRRDRIKPKTLPFGLEKEDLNVLSLDIEEENHIIVSGRVESGKTALLQTLILGMGRQFRSDEIDIYLIELEPKRNGMLTLASLPHVKGYATDLTQANELFDEIERELSTREGASLDFGSFQDEEGPTYKPLIIVVDDGENFMSQVSMDFNIKPKLENITKTARQKNVHFIFAGSVGGFTAYGHDTWFVNLKKKFTGILLGSTMSNDLYFFNMRLTHSETDRELPTGEGFIIRGQHEKIKAALPFLDKEEQKSLLAKLSKTEEFVE
jgi:S-DNA-T family DNA segregation ATPase FtsK/SpoIIIE